MPATCSHCHKDVPDNAHFCRHCGAVLGDEDAAPDPLMGQTIMGRYEVTSLLGEGGMGRVYLAEQRMGTTTRKVAIKTLRPQLSADRQVVRRFYREAETVVQLSHPNTIQFFDFGELDDGTLVIVMEYIEGKSLAAVLKAGPLDPQLVDKLMVQICGSLQEAHQAGIVHRDLKPDNILLTERGGQTDFVKVLDFGIAKANEAEDEGKQTKLTQQGMIVGTPPYMSPEQFSGEQLDPRSDVYSLGVVTYEMLTGKLPFSAKTPWEWASKHLTAQPEPMHELQVRGSIMPPGKSAAVLKALSKSRDERQSDVVELLRELTGFDDPAQAWTGMAAASATGSAPLRRADVPAVAQPQTTTENSASLTTNELRLQGGGGRWVALAAALFLLAGGAVAAWVAMSGEPEPPPVAKPPVPTAPKAPEPVATGAVVGPTPVEPPVEAAPQASAPARSDSDRKRRREKRRRERQAARERRAAETSGKADKQISLNPPPTATPRTMPAVTPAAPPPAKPRPTPPRIQAAPAPPAAKPKAPAPPKPMHVQRQPLPPQPIQTVAGTPSQDLNDRVTRGVQAARRGRVEQAISELQRASRTYGPGHPGIQSLRNEVARAGDTKMRQLVSGKRCAHAKALYRALGSAGVAANPNNYFSNSRCAGP